MHKIKGECTIFISFIWLTLKNSIFGFFRFIYFCSGRKQPDVGSIEDIYIYTVYRLNIFIFSYQIFFFAYQSTHEKSKNRFFQFGRINVQKIKISLLKKIKTISFCFSLRFWNHLINENLAWPTRTVRQHLLGIKKLFRICFKISIIINTETKKNFFWKKNTIFT